MGALATWMAMNYLGIGYWWMLVLAPLVVGVFGVIIERLLLRAWRLVSEPTLVRRLMVAQVMLLLLLWAGVFVVMLREGGDIASFPVELNKADGSSSAEIIAASEDGNNLVYSDSPGGGIGFVDITDPAAPQPAGYVALDGEPTSVTIIGAKVYTAVNTSESFVAPSGQLVVIDLASKAIEQTIELGGQPDSIAHNDVGTLIAIAIENERDEDVNDGAIPQLPAGDLAIVSLKDGVADCASIKHVALTGLAEVGADDPEPEGR